jgi:hypothetical protein
MDKHIYPTMAPPVLLILLALLSGCDDFQSGFDDGGIRDVAAGMLAAYAPGSPAELAAFVKSFDLERLTRPAVVVGRLEKRRINAPAGITLIQERVSFPSALASGLPEVDTARFYLYRQGPLGERPVILFAPGMGVQDLAFFFLQNYFERMLERGWDILLYVPPYHLERTAPGKKNGEGFFSADTLTTMRTFLSGVNDFRAAAAWLRASGVNRIGAWGGSMGAAMLLLLDNFEALDHLALMIPIVDWASVFAYSPPMREVRDRLLADGFDGRILERAHALISPSNYAVRLDSSRIQVLYGQLDHVARPEPILAWAADKGIRNLKVYDKSHTTILFESDMYRDYADFLNMID